MRFWNDGKGEANILQNQFTKYLIVSIQRKKAAILMERSKIQNHESSTDDWDASLEAAVEEDYIEQVSSPMDFEDAALRRALAQLKERDRYIFFARVLDEKEFYDLAIELGMSYKGVAAAYYRVIAKIKKEMRGEP